MARIKQYDKRSGKTYIYESVSFWDKEKKQSRSKRRLIGRLDEETGQMVDTDGRRRKSGAALSEQDDGRATSAIDKPLVFRKFCGVSLLLDGIAEAIGLKDDLKACFPDTYSMILSIAYYMIQEDASPLYRFHGWDKLHLHPYGRDIPSQRSSDLFAAISEEQKTRFFQLQGRRRNETEYLAYDTTSLSSYSECLVQVKYGKNKDFDPLPQVNLLLVFGEESYLPFFYRKIAGNVPDAATVRVCLDELGLSGYSGLKLVKDRGFFTSKNIDALFEQKVKFLVGAKMSTSIVREAALKMCETIRDWKRYDDKLGTYTSTECTTWERKVVRPRKGDTITVRHRVYIHIYYNPEAALEDELRLNAKISELKGELESGKLVQQNQKLYDKYFVTRRTSKGLTATLRQKVYDEEKRFYGFFALMSNDIKDARKALGIYRNKDVVEKAFGNYKERLNGRRMLVSSDQSLSGKLFVQFVALIILSYINKRMSDNNMYKKYTTSTLLDELETIESYKYHDGTPRLGEVLTKQREIFQCMGIEPPSQSSLCIMSGI